LFLFLILEQHSYLLSRQTDTVDLLDAREWALEVISSRQLFFPPQFTEWRGNFRLLHDGAWFFPSLHQYFSFELFGPACTNSFLDLFILRKFSFSLAFFLSPSISKGQPQYFQSHRLTQFFHSRAVSKSSCNPIKYSYSRPACFCIPSILRYHADHLWTCIFWSSSPISKTLNK